jgi:hypothetical protein
MDARATDVLAGGTGSSADDEETGVDNRNEVRSRGLQVQAV